GCRSGQVHEEFHQDDLDGGKGDRHAQEHWQQDHRHQGGFAGQVVAYPFLEVGKQHSSFSDRVDDGGEVVILQHDVGRFACHVGACLAHRYPNVSSGQCGSVVDAITGDCHPFTLVLQDLHNAQFVCWSRARVDGDLADVCSQPI